MVRIVEVKGVPQMTPIALKFGIKKKANEERYYCVYFSLSGSAIRRPMVVVINACVCVR